jgi:CRP/FNR family transcriptional regulator
MDEATNISGIFANEPSVVMAAGTTLLQPDTKPVHAILLERGVVKVLSFSDEGTSVLIHLLLPGSAFPLLSMSTTYTNRFWFQAMTEVCVRQVRYAAFAQAILKSPAVLAEQYEKMVQAVDGLSYRVESLIAQDVSSRLWGALGYLQKHFGVVTVPGVTQINLHVTHQDLASFIGASRETVSREWERLKAAGKVDVIDGRIVMR